MQLTRLPILAGLIVLALLAGCQEPDETAQSRSLQQAVQEAQRLTAAAQARLSNPVIRNVETGKLNPIPESEWRQIEAKQKQLIAEGEKLQQSAQSDQVPSTDEQKQKFVDSLKETGQKLSQTLEVLPGTAVHPEVEALLNKAAGRLETALAQSRQARPDAIDLAEQTLGRVYAELASLKLFEASGLRVQAMANASDAAILLTKLSDQQMASRQQDLFLADLNRNQDLRDRQAEVEAERSQADKALEALTSQKSSLETQIGDLRDQLATIRNQYDRAMAEAKATAGAAGLEKTDKAMETLKTISTTQKELAAAESRLTALEEQLLLAVDRVNTAKQRQQIIAGLQTGRGDETTRYNAALQAAQASIRGEEGVKKVEALIADAASLATKAKALEDEAANVIEKALGRFRKVRGDASALAQQGDLKMKQAALITSQEDLQRQLSSLASSARAFWETAKLGATPDSVAALDGYMLNVNSADERIQAYAKEAKDLYEQAARRVDRGSRVLQQQYTAQVEQATKAGAAE